MGLRIDRDRFEESEYGLFAERLRRSLEALELLLARPGFGRGPVSVGAELELCLVDGAARPLPLNDAVLAETVDPRMTVELDRFNVECNLRWSSLAGRPFTGLRAEFEGALAELSRAARTHGGRVVMIGVLPTLQPSDLQRTAMTDLPRYRALAAGLQRLRRGPFRMRIDGVDPLEIDCDEITFEGANTSLQVHLRVDPDDFADVYNSVQLATAPLLALAGNSPTFLGHRLWEETRIALFKQAVDARGMRGGGSAARVSFGADWLRGGALDLFAESVLEHSPLLPIVGDEDPLASVRAGGVPRLDEVRLHQSTIWRWNRAIYDPAEGGHLRIEMRSLPAGPTVPDMLANMAFGVGLALGLAPVIGRYTAGLPFGLVHRNFYRAAQRGLGACLVWPREGNAPGSPEACDARALALRLLPIARRGLRDAGLEPTDFEPLLDLISARVTSGRTGARWQAETLAQLEARLDRERALTCMLERYLEHAEGGEPVHTWPVDG